MLGKAGGKKETGDEHNGGNHTDGQRVKHKQMKTEEWQNCDKRGGEEHFNSA